MNLVDIDRAILRKMNKWFESIKEDSVSRAVAENTVVMGGCIASMLLGKRVNDYDVYMRDPDVVKMLITYYFDQIKAMGGSLETSNERWAIVGDLVINPAFGLEPGVQPLMYHDSDRPIGSYSVHYDDAVTSALDLEDKICEEGEPYIPIAISDNAITLSNDVQVVIRFFGDPEDIAETYDFAHCKGYWCSWKNEDRIHVPEDALLSLLSKELKYIGDGQYPLSSLFRANKFLRRDFKVRLSELLKIAYHLSQLDLSDPYVLERQLIGMDVAYFQEVIDCLQGDDGDFEDRIGYTMLCDALEEAL